MNDSKIIASYENFNKAHETALSLANEIGENYKNGRHPKYNETGSKYYKVDDKETHIQVWSTSCQGYLWRTIGSINIIENELK